MDKHEIIKNIAERTGGDIYLGVVGAVRTGKSTFIKKVIETLVVPNIKDEYERKRALDEIPQSSSGKTIMTIEPKFVPNTAAKVEIDDFSCNIRLIDCVGYIIDNAKGAEDENGPRMVKCPWYNEEIPFVEAAELGTEKVIKDHSTIGIVVTTDGSFGELKREDYLDAEEKVIGELLSIGKPFIIVLNSSKPNSTETRGLAESLQSTYNVPVMPMNVESMEEPEILEILKQALYEFPILDIAVELPEWVHVLPNTHEIKKHYLDKIRESVINVSKVRDAEEIMMHFTDSEIISKAYISQLDTASGVVHIRLESEDSLYQNVLKSLVGDAATSKAGLLKVFTTYAEGKEELDGLKDALKMTKSTGYGIVYPTLKDMKLSTPEIIKQGSRYGVKLKAVASSIHMMKVDVESTFEPIIGSELQSKELINYLMKDYQTDPSSIWKSEIFGRSLEVIVKEGIQAKLSIMPPNTRYKLSQTVTKIVNKGSSNLIAFVI